LKTSGHVLADRHKSPRSIQDRWSLRHKDPAAQG
jgi:hypothetical protein